MGGECDVDGIRGGLACQFAAEFAAGIAMATIYDLMGLEPPHRRSPSRDALLKELRKIRDGKETP